MVKNFKYLFFLQISTCIVSMEWSGDVTLHDIYNNTNKNMIVEIGKRGKDTIITTNTIAPQKNVPNEWNIKLNSKKKPNPNTIIVRDPNSILTSDWWVYAPSGDTKDIDLVIKRNRIVVIPHGNKRNVKSPHHSISVDNPAPLR